MQLTASRMLPTDVLRAGSIGLRTRRMRAVLSAIGIAIGIASMVAVLGISESSKAQLLAQLDRLGTNLLTVAPGQSILGEEAELPVTARTSISAIADVLGSSSVKTLSDATVRRNDRIPEAETGGITVMAADSNLARTVSARLRTGRFLDGATSRYPAVVLGHVAAKRLGITTAGVNVRIGQHWFTVVGILDRVTLDPALDTAALVGYDVAEALLGADRSPTKVYVRTNPERVTEVQDLLAATANPEHPEETTVSRPSDALAARAAAKSAFTALFLGLGAVALLVGGVGIANVMVISVLERRSEIGLRRAIGATRRHIAQQFLAESLLLAVMGGAAGSLLGAAVTAAYATSRGWDAVVPLLAVGGALGAALGIGALAWLYPAMRAARLAPTDALRTV